MSINDIKVKECPYCKGTEFGEGYQKGSARVVTNTFGLGQNLYHIICLTCGSIVRSYVKNPINFKNK